MNTETECENMRNKIDSFITTTKDDWNYITPTYFYNKYFVNRKFKKYILIDIRKPDVFKQNHIDGAINIFWLELFKKENIDKLKEYNKQSIPIFLICYVGHTSSQALVLLRLSGITNVTSIKFGYGISPVVGVPVAGWQQYGYPLVSDIKCNNYKIYYKKI
jgi:rhodanese-related sulfurtransferase